MFKEFAVVFKDNNQIIDYAKFWGFFKVSAEYLWYNQKVSWKCPRFITTNHSISKQMATKKLKSRLKGILLKWNKAVNNVFEKKLWECSEVNMSECLPSAISDKNGCCEYIAMECTAGHCKQM